MARYPRSELLNPFLIGQFMCGWTGRNRLLRKMLNVRLNRHVGFTRPFPLNALFSTSGAKEILMLMGNSYLRHAPVAR